jgi:hypothetical protein
LNTLWYWPISACTNEIITQFITLPPTDEKTLRQYIIIHSNVVGLLIKQRIKKGCAVADGWSSANVHYIGLKHYWMEKNDTGNGIEVVLALLSLVPPVVASSAVQTPSLYRFLHHSFLPSSASSQRSGHWHCSNHPLPRSLF